MNEAMHDFLRFEDFVRRAFEALGYETKRKELLKNPASRIRYVADFVVTKSGKSDIIEVKYYTANSRPQALIGRAFLQVEKALRDTPEHTGIVVSNANLNVGRVAELQKRYDGRIQYWSVKDLADKLVEHPTLFEEALFYDAENSGRTNIEGPVPSASSVLASRQQDILRDKNINSLLNELKNCPVSKGPPFEKVCEKILKLVFENQLASWKAQNRTDGGLHKHDLIARVLNLESSGVNTAKEDFWSIVSRHFNCRYITFEFKNYSKPIKQGEVLTTEKYLYLKALRSVAVIIARKGADQNAIQTMKGALRENGKLILCLTTKDLENMLLKVQVGDDAQQVLIEKLDDHLLTINR